MRLIDADALKLNAWPERYTGEGIVYVEDIDNAPTVEAVEVVHGRWLKTCLPDIYHCTNCKRATKMDELCDSEILRAYCPICGAKMDGDGNV